MYRATGCLAAVTIVICTGCGTSVSKSSDPLLALQDEAFRRYASGDLNGALELFGAGLQRASRASDSRALSRLHQGVGLCHLSRSQYSAALTEFQESLSWARRDQRISNASDLFAAASANLAMTYGRMGDFENSKRAAREGLAAKPGAYVDAQLRLNLAICHTEEGPPEEADRLLRDLIERMRQKKDYTTLGRALERYGYHLTKTGRLAEAEAPLLESLRVRKQHGDPEHADPYFVLARLRHAQGRPAEALAALELYAASGRKHYWRGRVHDLRGQILEAAGQPERALAEYREAVQAMRRRRSHIRPSERLLRVSELALPELYENFIRLASRRYAQTGGALYLAEAMAASEEIRVTFQRQEYYSPDRWAHQYGAYRDLLAQLDALEASGTAPSDPRVDRLQLELARQEARMASDEPLLMPPATDPATHLVRLRAGVARDEAVFVFHVNDRSSLGWLVTRERVLAAELPPAAEIRALVDAFRQELKSQSTGAVDGLRLYAKILDPFTAAARSKLHWSFVLDGPLFEVPWLAVPLPAAADQRAGRSQAMLADRHAVSLLPSLFPESKVAPRPVTRLFAAIGDPVYNAADPRYAGARLVGPNARVPNAAVPNAALTIPALTIPASYDPATRIPASQSPTSQSPTSQSLASRHLAANAPANELARLPGTAAEIDRASQIWQTAGYQPETLLGERATGSHLVAALGRRPAVLHLATHVVSGPEARVALSLRDGRPELLGARELSQLRLHGTAVVMAGCGSGRGTPQPVGLVSLTRAWLLSGASSVVASLWPVPDDAGEFTARLYSIVSATKTKEQSNGSHRLAWARALRQTVLEARDSSRLPAKTWAAYYLMGRN